MDKKYNPSEIEAKWPHSASPSPKWLRRPSKASRVKQKNTYNPTLIESKWQAVWEKERIYSPDLDKPFDKAQGHGPFYNLMMFPYPSAEGMHVGNMYAFTGADVYGRFQRMQGNDVFEPIGLDGFGIHSENYAIKIGRHPKKQAKISEKNFYRQLRATGNGFDWSRKLETYDSKYYKWTQWLFVQMFKAGLAYRKKAPVNFCPSCKTVLADEQVMQKIISAQGPDARFPRPMSSVDKLPAGTRRGAPTRVTPRLENFVGSPRSKDLIEEKINVCERCETAVEKKNLEQWFFRITKYADRLLANIDKLDWSEKVKIAQRQWIGRKEGINITYKVVDSREEIVCFTTTPVNFAATFIVLSPEHPLALRVTKKENLNEVMAYIKKAKAITQTERIEQVRDKTGVFTGGYAINHVTGEQIPIWISDFVLMDVGTGAIQGCPGHDLRDFEFAKKFSLPIVRVIVGLDGDKSEITRREQVIEKGGVMINSDFLNGLDFYDAMEKTKDYFEKKLWGRKVVTYHLRDWLISRQRYWGPPIPMIYCKKCDWQPVPEKDLPVLLPDVKDWKPKGEGKSPLTNIKSFVNTKCPNCKGSARRETDVSDTFLDSAWYFFRYLGTEFEDVPFPSQKLRSTEYSEFSETMKRLRKWLPVAMYIGGAEHSVLHLLYSRFITMALHDLGFISFDEPFARFYAHGLLIKEGAKMSKSKGNVVVPDAYIRKFGADTLRTYLMFMGPFSQGGDFRDSGIEGMHRFLKRIWSLVLSHLSKALDQRPATKDQLQMMNKTIKRVKNDMENLRYNTAIAALMEYYNFLSKQEHITIEEFRNLLKLIAPFAPHIAEELWEYIGGKFSVHRESFPKFNENALRLFHRTIAIQINGKLRDTVTVTDQASKNKDNIEQLARESDKIKKHLEGTTIKKVIYVEGKVINFVIG